MKHISIFLFVFILSFISCNETLKSQSKVVSPEEMQALLQLDNVQLVDVRTPEEYKSGHILNAQNIDFLSPTFNEDIKKLDKEKPVVLYCRSGGRSAKCSKKLIEAGFVKVYDLDGGISRWKHEGYEIEN